ncbi:DUF2515 domain-containing protein [Brevibacillus ruminantium]|uniref:DUF2515 domain-containing protein n=1 Tax=Brevibacillus ruminantium TaxID=2950604 RepID=A0ABY4WPK7_9BACL|nr:DUF2515 family protein [Brevibacillus ruminantium]USG68078.1 DUF2515 domain-containing protein [Brevibacillus ruminantium]
MKPIQTEDRDIIADIRRLTHRANRNNITRTQAYLAFFQNHSEVHWALLAHLVSRNGGWNMTDLHGEWLPRLMTAAEIKNYFWFLERCNWLIFHDAYAQLLLYEKMKRTGQDLTALLVDLGVSVFMQPIWQSFLHTKDSVRLTRALIINEQQYIEQRVVDKPFAEQQIFFSLAFFTQSILSLNQVIFPYKEHPTDRRLHACGISVHRFPSVTQRIDIGKTLYQLLFDNPVRLQSIYEWARRIPHTGSRADYWPHLFTPRKPASETDGRYLPRFEGKELIAGAPKLYSPQVSSVWPDQEHPPADGTDWYQGENWQTALEARADLPTLDEDQYIRSLRMIEWGVKFVQAFRP